MRLFIMQTSYIHLCYSISAQIPDEFFRIQDVCCHFLWLVTFNHMKTQDNLFSLPRLWGQTSSAAAAPRKNNQQKNFRQDKGLCLFLTLEKKTPKFCGKKERVIFMGFWSRDRAAIYVSPKM